MENNPKPEEKSIIVILSDDGIIKYGIREKKKKHFERSLNSYTV